MAKKKVNGQTRLDPWGTTLIKDYARVIEKFGIEPFDKKMLSRLPSPNHLMRRGIVFGHRELDAVADAIKNKKPFAVLTGIMPSAEQLHLGNINVIRMVKYFQDVGAETYILAADLEALATRGISLEESRERVRNFYLPAYIALGINPDRLHFYFQSQNKRVQQLAFEFAPRVTANEFRAIYGEVAAPKMMSALVQTADILYPQLPENGGPKPTVIPVGPDQDPHIRLSHDVAKRVKKYDFTMPGAVYIKFTPSLDGSLKMSKSKPGSYIAVPEDPEAAAKKIFGALTAGKKTAAAQRKFGADPNKSMVFEMLRQHLMEDDKQLEKLMADYRAGKVLDGESKQIAADLMRKFMTDFIKKFDAAKPKAEEILAGSQA